MVGAAVPVVEIAIVTGLARFDNAISTAWRDGHMDTAQIGVAAVVGAEILIVAIGFARPGQAGSLVAGVADGAHVGVITRQFVVDVGATAVRVTPVVGAGIGVITFGSARSRLAGPAAADVANSAIVVVVANGAVV